MTVDFYTFSKRINSTARPTGGASYSCVLKTASSVMRPVIALNWAGGGSPAAYNYAYIADYGRYYWVNNWTYADRQWVADLSVDVLATFKTEIGGASKYVLRAASDYTPTAVDTMWPALMDYTDAGTLSGTAMGWDSYGYADGSFVVTVVGKGNAVPNNCAVAMYVLSGKDVQDLITNQLNAIDGAYNTSPSNDIFEAIQKLLMLPFRFTSDLSQYIRNIMWFPFTFAVDTSSPIYLGLFQCLSTALPVANPLKTFTSTIDVSGFPAAGADPWEYMAPFGVYCLELQPFGIIPLDSSDVVDADTITCVVRVDAVSGLGLLTVTATKGIEYVRTIASRTAQVGVAVPYGGTAPNYAGAIAGAATVAATAAAYASGDASGGALMASIGSAVAAATPNGYSAGSSGGGAAVIGAVYLHYKVFDHSDVDVTEAGRPLCMVKTLNTLSGYVLCRDGDISASGTADELKQVESYLTGGFFYE